jgi:hypothetical protein
MSVYREINLSTIYLSFLIFYLVKRRRRKSVSFYSGDVIQRKLCFFLSVYLSIVLRICTNIT